MADSAILTRLKAKVGPLPVWGWGVIVGVAILIAYYYYSNNKKAAAAGDVVVSSDDLLGTLAGGGSSGSSDSGGSSSDIGEVTYETNTSWRQKGVALLVGSGVAPLTAQAALDNYLQGNTLTTAQAGFVNTVIRALGLPPDGTFGIPSVSDAPTPTDPDPTNPASNPATTPAAIIDNGTDGSYNYGGGSSDTAVSVPAPTAKILGKTPTPAPAPSPIGNPVKADPPAAPKVADKAPTVTATKAPAPAPAPAPAKATGKTGVSSTKRTGK